jgi:NTP pyrophosphatase (non-canonical NTP hydrolase)
MNQTKMKENAFTFYQRLAEKTAKENHSFDDPRHTRIAVASMGLAGETGELIDALKKWVAHGHELDLNHVESELGDILWYVSEIATVLDLRLADVAEANVEKLQQRYGDKFSEAKSRNRKV